MNQAYKRTVMHKELQNFIFSPSENYIQTNELRITAQHKQGHHVSPKHRDVLYGHRPHFMKRLVNLI